MRWPALPTLFRPDIWRAGIFVRMLGSAVIAQALLSAANLLVGLILIRRTTDEQYGSFVLVLNALMLITQLQTQFITAALVLRMAEVAQSERANLIGGLLREQRKLLPLIALGAALVTIGLWLGSVLPLATTLLILAAIAAALAALHREFFRMLLLVYRRPVDVLKSDTLYVVLLVGGVAFATRAPMPAVTAVVMLCVAAACGGVVLSKALWRHEPWNIHGGQGVLRQIAQIGAWTTVSSAIHWSFTQGYNYLIVGTLDVKAVAAVAATRLLLMPVNMLSTGVGSLMLPTTTTWLQKHGARRTFERLLLLSIGLAALAVCYFAVLWLLRGYIFQSVFKKQFARGDELVMLWFVIFVLMVFRDQLLFLPLARGRYRILTGLTLVSAIVSLSVSYVAMVHIGVVGALIGVLTGETISVAGLLVLSGLEIRKPVPSLAPA